MNLTEIWLQAAYYVVCALNCNFNLPVEVEMHSERDADYAERQR